MGLGRNASDAAEKRLVREMAKHKVNESRAAEAALGQSSGRFRSILRRVRDNW